MDCTLCSLRCNQSDNESYSSPAQLLQGECMILSKEHEDLSVQTLTNRASADAEVRSIDATGQPNLR